MLTVRPWLKTPGKTKYFVLLLILILSFSCLSIHSHAQAKNVQLKLLGVQKIWDKAPHNAFTDLIYAKGRWFCVFREGAKHVSPDGAIRVITSVDGEKWESAALLTSEHADLRDAKITLTPDGRLMLNGAGALHDKSVHTHQSLAWFSDDGFTWSKGCPVGDPDFWLWRTTWHNNKAYGFGYACGEEKSLRFYQSNDGKDYQVVLPDLEIEGYPNETSVVFINDTAFCLLRRDGELKTAKLGISTPPYNQWEWKDLGIQIGGPHMILLPNGSLLAAVRLQKDKSNPKRTALCLINSDTGHFQEMLKLPSGGDTSYAGMVLKDNTLWVSYYSSHEDKTSIYLARVAVEFL